MKNLTLVRDGDNIDQLVIPQDYGPDIVVPTDEVFRCELLHYREERSVMMPDSGRTIKRKIAHVVDRLGVAHVRVAWKPSVISFDAYKKGFAIYPEKCIKKVFHGEGMEIMLEIEWQESILHKKDVATSFMIDFLKTEEREERLKGRRRLVFDDLPAPISLF